MTSSSQALAVYEIPGSVNAPLGSCNLRRSDSIVIKVTDLGQLTRAFVNIRCLM